MLRQLAKKRTIKFGSVEIERTPLLVPSFSSKGFPEVKGIIETSAEFISGPALISAYDIWYKQITGPFSFPSLLFLDSGGYEASKDSELSDLREREHEPEMWSADRHRFVLDRWTSNVPTVIVSYDHPKERVGLCEQITRARDLFASYPSLIPEILLKPVKSDSKLVDVKDIIEHVHQLAPFSVIGVTEKEIGNSLFLRMQNIAKLRTALNRAGLSIPLHIFGSLDTITTLMYFVAGADIFDGLTWLRFAFHQGQTLYRQNYGALQLNPKTKAHMIDPMCWTKNLGYLQDMELEMTRFLATNEFGSFAFHGGDIKRTYESVMEGVDC